MNRDWLQTTFPTISRWRIRSSRYLLHDRWFTVRADCCDTAEGHVVDPWYVVEAPNTVQMVIMNDQQQILLVCQYRHAAQTISLEFPCGEIDPGEDPVSAIHRELLEETGYAVRAVHLAGRFFANPARQTTVVHTYVGTGAHRVGEPKQDPTERINYRFFSLPELEDFIRNGTFAQGLHIGSWYMAKEVISLQMHGEKLE